MHGTYNVKLRSVFVKNDYSVFWELYEAFNYTVWQNAEVMHAVTITILNVTTVCNIL